MEKYLSYIFIVFFIGFILRRAYMFSAIKKKLPQLLKEGAIIVDVRSPGEYKMGHVDGSINIPLEEISNRYGELDQNTTLLLCCASGNRSGVAASMLKAKGFKNVHNAGGWSGLLMGGQSE